MRAHASSRTETLLAENMTGARIAIAALIELYVAVSSLPLTLYVHQLSSSCLRQSTLCDAVL